MNGKKNVRESHKVSGSTQIEKLEWSDDAGKGRLTVTFEGGQQYRYGEVPKALYDLLVQANLMNEESETEEISVGSLFHYLVKIHPDKYPYEKLS
jgi:hypothetical protein